MSQRVTAQKYNNLQQRIAAILGNSSGSTPLTGYGQNVESTVHYPVQADVSKITANQYRDLYIDLVRARVHQIGSSNFNIDDFVSNTAKGISRADKVELSYINSLESLMTTIENDKFDVHGTQINLELFDPLGRGYTDRRVSSWNTEITQVFRISWGSTSARNHFFNAGGEIRMQISLTNGSGGKASDWANLFQTAGTVRFAQNQVFASSGLTSLTGNRVLTQLSPGFHTIYSKRSNSVSNSGAYSQNIMRINARNINSATIEFELIFNDLAGDNNIDNLVIGTVSTSIQSATPFGSVVIDGQSYPTVQLPAPIYSGITSISDGTATIETPPPAPVYDPAGTFLGDFCQGFDLVGTYADGSGGTYTQTIESNSASCGYEPPCQNPPNITASRGTYAQDSRIIWSNGRDSGYLDMLITPFDSRGATIKGWYLTYLGRDADWDGWNYWYDEWDIYGESGTLTAFLNAVAIEQQYGTPTVYTYCEYQDLIS